MGFIPGFKTKKESDGRVRGRKGNWSLVNKLSSINRSLSGTAGIAIALAPKQAGAVRDIRNKSLKYNRLARDANALLNRNIKKRVLNRTFGRAAGLATNLVLPPVNNILLRLVRAKIGGTLNRKIHGVTKGPRLKIFGRKATKKYEKLFSVDVAGNIFLMMQKTLQMGMQVRAPRTKYVMMLKGSDDPIEFGPNNLATSIFSLDPEIRPNKNILARYTVTAGSSMQGVMVADRAPYVWVANYGGILFDPTTGENDKIHPPSFFAQKALRFTAQTYAPAIKKIAQVIDPHGLGSVSTKNILKVKESERAQAMYKIWLNKDGERLKKEKDFNPAGVKRNSSGKVVRGRTVDGKFIEDEYATAQGINYTLQRDKSAKFGYKLSRTEVARKDKGKEFDGRRKKNFDLTYEGKDGVTMGGYYGLPEKTYEAAARSGAEEVMELLYGGKKFEKVKKVKVKQKEYKRKNPQKTKNSKRRGKNYQPKAKYKTQSVRGSEHTRKYKQTFDIGVALPDTGQIPIVADMRALKKSQKSKGRYIAGKNNRFKTRYLDAPEIKISDNNVMDFGMIQMNKETKAELKKLREKGIIDFTFKGNQVQNAVILDLDRFEKEFGVVYGRRDMYDVSGRYNPMGTTRTAADSYEIEKEVARLKKSGKLDITQKEEQQLIRELNKSESLGFQSEQELKLTQRIWDPESGSWKKTASGKSDSKQTISIINKATVRIDPKTGNPVITHTFAKQAADVQKEASDIVNQIKLKLTQLRRNQTSLKNKQGVGGTAGFSSDDIKINQLKRAIKGEGVYADKFLGVQKKVEIFDEEGRKKLVNRIEPLIIDDELVEIKDGASLLAKLEGRAGATQTTSNIQNRIDSLEKEIQVLSTRLTGKKIHLDTRLGAPKADEITIDELLDSFVGGQFIGGRVSASSGTMVDYLNQVDDLFNIQETKIKQTALNAIALKRRKFLTEKARGKGLIKHLDIEELQPNQHVSAVSGKLNAVASQTRNRQSARSTDSGLVRLNFKVDESQTLRLQEKTGGFIIQVRQPKLRGKGSTRDRRTDSVKTLYASNTRYTKNSVIFEFDDPSLPTEQLVLKANLKDGKIKKGGIELRTQSGTVQNLTRTQGTGILFVDEGEGKLRLAKATDNIAPEKKRVYGVKTSDSGNPAFADNAAVLINASKEQLDLAMLTQTQAGMGGPLSDIAILLAAIESNDTNTRYKNKKRDFRGYRTRGNKSGRGYIIRFEDL